MVIRGYCDDCGKNEEVIMLVHESAKIEYGDEGIFKEVSKKMYPKQYFSSQ